jgi:hypothetical protein
MEMAMSNRLSSSKELGKCAYCKWHDSFSHNTCDCNVFRRQFQSAIDEGRLKFRDHLDTRGTHHLVKYSQK